MNNNCLTLLAPLAFTVLASTVAWTQDAPPMTPVQTESPESPATDPTTNDDATADDVSTSTEEAASPNELPATASPLAVYALLGLLSLGGAAALRLRRSRQPEIR